MNSQLPLDRRVLRLLLTTGGAVAWGLMLGGFYLGVHGTLRQRHEAQHGRIEALEVLLRDHAQVHAQHRRLTGKLQGLNSQIETIRRRVPSTPMEADFLSTASTIAEEERVAIQDFRRESTLEYEDYSEATVVIRGTGSYASLCRFLDRIGKLERVSTVRKMSLKSGVRDSGYPFEVTYALQFRMQTGGDDDATSASEDVS